MLKAQSIATSLFTAAVLSLMLPCLVPAQAAPGTVGPATVGPAKLGPGNAAPSHKTKVDNEVKQSDSESAQKPEVKVKDQPTKNYEAKLQAKEEAGKSATDTKVKSAKGELSAKQAEKLVRERKEVKEWLALFKKAKKDHRKVGTPEIEVERDGANWMVHVFEQMPDHTATVNWYTVDPKTSKITTMF